jgi:hypothetical protein
VAGGKVFWATVIFVHVSLTEQPQEPLPLPQVLPIQEMLWMTVAG